MGCSCRFALVAMQLTTGVNWTPGDFSVFGSMLLLAGASLELVVRLVRNRGKRAILVAVIASVFLAVWAQGAVGLI